MCFLWFISYHREDVVLERNKQIDRFFHRWVHEILVIFTFSIPFHIIAKNVVLERNKQIDRFFHRWVQEILVIITFSIPFHHREDVVFQNPTCWILQVSSEKRATDARLTLGVRYLRHGTFPIVGASVTLSVYQRLDLPICIIMWRMTSNRPESDMSNSSRFKKSRLEPWIMINVGPTLEKSSGKGLQLLLCPWVVRNNFAH